MQRIAALFLVLSLISTLAVLLPLALSSKPGQDEMQNNELITISLGAAAGEADSTPEEGLAANPRPTAEEAATGNAVPPPTGMPADPTDHSTDQIEPSPTSAPPTASVEPEAKPAPAPSAEAGKPDTFEDETATPSATPASNTEEPTLEVTTQPVAQSEALGEQRTAVILIDYQNDGEEQPPEWYRDALFEGEHSINNFVRECSYGQTWLTGDVFGWYHVTAAPEWLRTPPYYPNREEVLAIADQDVDYADYDRLVFVYRCHLDEVGGGWGRSSFGKTDINTPDGTVRASFSEIRAATLIYPGTDVSRTHSMVIAHELMHAFGVPGHANAYLCEGTSIAGDTAKCNQLARGDAFDIMGGRYWASHPNAAHKETLGWLHGEQITTVEESGTYDLHPLEQSTARVLRIPLRNPVRVSTVNNQEVSISAYYLEYRVASGFDERLTGLANGAYLAPAPVDIEGVMIRGAFFHEGQCTTTYLLDATPGSFDGAGNAANDFIDCFLKPGMVFYDRVNGLTVEASRVLLDGGFEVRVERKEV